ncbi:MAG: hypothetical protein RL701_6631 [Pseudomonadota bacterium]|jgi:hypothetical protein
MVAERARRPQLQGVKQIVLAMASAASCAGLAACTSAMFEADASPFSQAEITRSLSPASQFERSCYKGSQSEREHKRARFEFVAYVNEKGGVHADFVGADALDPGLLECFRTHIESLQFPAKGATDQFHLRFDCKP